jgi:molybdopterin adenylyltransferase
VPFVLKIVVITVSDRAFRGEYPDLSGPEIKRIIDDSDIGAEVSLLLVPDEEKEIRQAVTSSLGADYILTTGGTGLSSRDITPEVSRDICDREIPGISEMIRRESCLETRYAVFSRGFSGIKGRTILINFPGSQKAVRLATRLVLPLLAHGTKMARGEGH